MSKYIISGGGTGGHIFPALAIAEALKKQDPAAEFLFVGAEGKMEMERVPRAGYKIIGLPIRGFERKLSLNNFLLIFKILKSMWMARQIVKDFKPDVAIGVGGYASGPLLKAAASMGVKTLLQEQNSYAGATNRLLAKKAAKICVAYDNVARFFPKEKVVKTGNPVREELVVLANSPDREVKKKEAYAFFGLSPEKKTLFITGGSLGARTLNQSCEKALEAIAAKGFQVIWQIGKFYEADFLPLAKKQGAHVWANAFVERMDLAYLIADVVVARAGALTLAEICVMSKAAILVPSPNVAEDHQTANAKELSEKGAALLVPEAEAPTRLFAEAFNLLENPEKIAQLGRNAKAAGSDNAAEQIAKQIVQLINNK